MDEKQKQKLFKGMIPMGVALFSAMSMWPWLLDNGYSENETRVILVIYVIIVIFLLRLIADYFLNKTK